MQRAFLLTVVLLAVPLAVCAQFGTIGLYADAGASQCQMDDEAQGILSIHVIHTGVIGSKGSLFMIARSPGFTAEHIGDSTPYLTIGTSQTGISVAYGECVEGPIHIMEVKYLFDGTSSACGYLEVVADPVQGWDGPVAADCETYANGYVVPGGRLYVNPDGSCPCLSPVPTKETTWGQLKALYQE